TSNVQRPMNPISKLVSHNPVCHISSPSPREARTGRGLGVPELGQQPSSPRLRGRSHFGTAKARSSPPLVGGEGDNGSSRRAPDLMAVAAGGGPAVYVRR